MATTRKRGSLQIQSLYALCFWVHTSYMWCQWITTTRKGGPLPIIPSRLHTSEYTHTTYGVDKSSPNLHNYCQLLHPCLLLDWTVEERIYIIQYIHVCTGSPWWFAVKLLCSLLKMINLFWTCFVSLNALYEIIFVLWQIDLYRHRTDFKSVLLLHINPFVFKMLNRKKRQILNFLLCFFYSRAILFLRSFRAFYYFSTGIVSCNKASKLVISRYWRGLGFDMQYLHYIT